VFCWPTNNTEGVNKIIDILNSYVDKVIFVYESMKCDAEKRFMFNNPTAIKNGFDKNLFTYQTDQKKKNDSSYHIVSVGNLENA